jgi:hypothetical protein
MKKVLMLVAVVAVVAAGSPGTARAAEKNTGRGLLIGALIGAAVGAVIGGVIYLARKPADPAPAVPPPASTGAATGGITFELAPVSRPAAVQTAAEAEAAGLVTIWGF